MQSHSLFYNMNQLQKLMDDVATEWAIIPESYPEIAGKNSEQIFDFGVRHSALHLAKSSGKIARYAEACDHGTAGDRAELKETTIKLFLSVIRLAHLQGLSAEDVIALAPSFIYDGVSGVKVK